MSKPVDKIRAMWTYHYSHTIPTNVSKDYLTDSGTNWNEWEMLRETFQNAMDESQYMVEEGIWDEVDGRGVVEWEDIIGQYEEDAQLADFCKSWINGEWLFIGDMGRGVDLEKILLIGESGKRGEGYRGEKGEGELLSFLVAARLGIEKWMFSQDWAVTARFDDYNGSKYQVLVLDVYKTAKPRKNNLKNRKWGTLWKYRVTPKIMYYYDDLYNRFPDLSRQRVRSIDAIAKRQQREDEQFWKQQSAERKRRIRQKSTASKKRVFKPRNENPARLYHKGIWVKDMDNALFSYNIPDEWNIKIGRDRSLIDDFEILKAINRAFNHGDFTASMAQLFWKVATSKTTAVKKMEYRQVIALSSASKKAQFKRAFHKVYGKNACLQTDNYGTVEAINMGYRVVDLDGNARQLAEALGIPTDLQASGSIDGVRYIKDEDLTKEDLIRLGLVYQIVEALGFDLPDCKVASNIRSEGSDREVADGLWLPKDKRIVVHVNALRNDDPLRLLHVYLHELGHKDSGASDGTREFQTWFLDQWITLMLFPVPEVQELIGELTSYGSSDYYE
jgi:hypothetical protein